MALPGEQEPPMDHVYGVPNVGNQWIMGNSLLEIYQHDDKLHIIRERHKGTPGLYLLMFMKHPDVTEI